jgi:hypothetical protein
MLGYVISKVLEQASLSLNDLDLIVGQNLFAERTPKEQCVVIKTFGGNYLDDISANIRSCPFKIYVNGYAIDDGFRISETITFYLDEYSGSYPYSNYVYHIKSITPRTTPSLIIDQDYNIYTTTFDINFILIKT